MDSLSESELEFRRELETRIKLVRLYENLNLLKYAADLIPSEDLNIRATLKFSLLETENCGIRFEDVMLLELLNWFKCSFFSWVDIPECETCSQTPLRKGLASPSEAEVIWGADRVEEYFCPRCQKDIRFPRYNHPKKLLETRRGRCGEWANCFTLLCRALGYDARLVMDWGDHMWTEVFSFSKNRWLHCDPCENVCDKPLMYEKGWKKKITYVVAFSKDEVQDVTWRYTSQFSEVLGRRTLCREEWLTNFISSLTQKLQANVSPERKRELTLRRVLELAEFLTPPQCDENFEGRTSGSLAWRIARGEVAVATSQNAYVFYLCPDEIEHQHFHVKYSCALDRYVRISDKSREETSWTTCTYEHSNVFRKVESDWKMVYLARTEGSPRGQITWKFNFEGSGLVIRTLRANLQSTTFEQGRVKWFISPDREQRAPKVYEADDVSPLQTQEFKGLNSLTISVELLEGTGGLAWQHSQLFRQPIDSTEFPFEIEMSLDKDVSISQNIQCNDATF